MPAHSTVNYVEPNALFGLNDGFERAPSLEDYCIALNLEVEISSRDAQGQKDVLILQWRNNDKGTVSFMGGTKMGGYDIEGLDRKARLKGQDQNLTTYYADLYVGDLINYGTTEMIGIKSVDISYKKSCVPVINIQFTDVRGFSLFQPTELSRTNIYDGIRGISKDNIAQSFFQCFFKLPLPKFTIYIKGFYGKPVAYEMVCDGFETNFNSETGDYDVNTKFIGYGYSFLTDISFDAVLAAPYSDFIGRKYWNDNLNTRFKIKDKNGVEKPMPTLYEIHEDIDDLLSNANRELLETTLTEEEKTHAEEIAKLIEIKGYYINWYTTLFNLLKDKFGKRYCFDFKSVRATNNEEEWYRILVLTTDEKNGQNLSEYYKQFSDDFKEINKNLYSAIEDFNKSGLSYKTFKNISQDFSEYTNVRLFNDCFVNHNTRKIEFGGFSQTYAGNKTEIINRLFYNVTPKSTDNASGETSAEEVNKKINQYKEYTLSTIYNDGVSQYTNAFLIEVDYSSINRRIAALEEDKKKSNADKEYDKRRKEHNRILINSMTWYPSVENFTKILMAHVETYIMMLFKVQEMAKGRTAESLGITIGPDGNGCDVRADSAVVPPFPRVVKNEIGDDNIEKRVDEWVGNFSDSNAFVEADMVNGIFQGMQVIKNLSEQHREEILKGKNSGFGSDEDATTTVKYPLTSYDFYLTKNVYGEDTDISNNPNAFAGKVAMRMFMIMSLNNFAKDLGNDLFGKNNNRAAAIGRIEAENFYNSVKITNAKMLDMLGVDGGAGTITSDAIINCVTNGTAIGNYTEIPWKQNRNDDNLFNNKLWLTRYTSPKQSTTKYDTRIYPIQDMSFSKLNDTLKIFNKGGDSIDWNNNDIFLSYLDVSSSFGCMVKKLIDSDNKSMFGATYISENYKRAYEILEKSSTNDDYKDIAAALNQELTFDKDTFKSFINTKGVFRPRLGITTGRKSESNIPLGKDKDLTLKVNRNTNTYDKNGTEETYKFDKSKLDSYVDEAENQSISSWFFTECRGFYESLDKNGNEIIRLDRNRSFFQQNFEDDIKSLTSENGSDKWPKTYSDDIKKKLAFIIMGFDAIDYNAVNEKLTNASGNTFVYLPKLAVLQIGAALMSLLNIKENIYSAGSEKIKNVFRFIPIPDTFEIMYNSQYAYLVSLTSTARVAYVRYFSKWCDKYGASLLRNLEGKKEKNGSREQLNAVATYVIGSYKRTLFREDSDFSKGLADNLMSPILVTKASVNHYRTGTDGKLELSNGIAKQYLDGFLNRLKELYAHGGDGKYGDAVKLVEDPEKISDDIKKSLYNFIKLGYDKWIPATTMEEWMFERFFDYEKSREVGGGHLFHFIDSYYNKIGDKLLVNPKDIGDYIGNILQAKNIHDMVIGFMTKIFGDNKCMFIPLQNFQDLSNEDAMKMMFKPIPYNEMEMANKHPDFVVVYPYEPSKHLNVDNAEYNDDSFMLNNEFETPLPIRSRSNEKDYYRIPAFGVSYGKQYQSYFKKIGVGTKNPIATQQAIVARQNILNSSQDAKAHGTVGQDIYDIYASQSYTCTVEMMGCAWVQPLMYFVLTNVPMFKGSYLIIEVTHKITPGDMTTTFKGARMANVSTKLVEEIFTDDFSSDSSVESYSYIDDRNRLADIDNDCPYKVYPLDEVDSVALSKDEMENANKAMKILIETYHFSQNAAAGICGNIYKESTWRLHATNGIGAFGLCQWLGVRKKLLIEKYGELPTFSQQMEYINYEWDNEEVAKNHKTQLNNASTPQDAAYIVRKFFERPGEAEADDATRKAKAKAYFDHYGSSSNTQEEVKPNGSDINDKFLRAVQKSLASTNANSKNFQIRKGAKSTSENLIIESVPNGNTRLDLVFDIILNGYYDYVQRLGWVLNKGDRDYRGKPLYLEVTVKEKVEPQYRRVYIYRFGENPEKIKFNGSSASAINRAFLKSLYKRYKGELNNDIPQIKDAAIFGDESVFGKDGIQIKNCDTLMSSYIGKGNNSIWAKAVQSMGKWYEANVHTYQKHINSLIPCDLLGGSGVRDDCSGYVSACLQYFGVFKKGQITTSNGFTSDANIAATLMNGGFKRIPYSWSTVEPYDIISYNGHVEILASKENSPKSWSWGSVHDGKNGHSGMPAYTYNKNAYKNIWRYIK